MNERPAHGVTPVSYGQGRAARGNYAQARADFTCDQLWQQYTPEQHELYRRLHERQSRQLASHACEEFINSVEQLGAPQSIPRFDALSERLHRATRWEVVAVPGLIPDEAFFALLAKRRFPVTWWLREAHEFDYIVEPDVFHDLFGHVPLLFDPVFADFMQAYGLGGLKAARLSACDRLARLYWFTVEFGLINTDAGVRSYGAGLLSSAGELVYSVRDPKAQRIAFDVRRIMRTRYRIDVFQPTYFVIDSFEQLFEATTPDFTPLYAEVQSLPELLSENGPLPNEQTYSAA